MKVIRAKKAGFCMGVDRAVRILEATRQKNAGPIYTLGPIIHNPQVLQYYAEKGVQPAGDLTSLPAGASLVIRAHGIPRDLERQLDEQGFGLVDATCHKVKKAQMLIASRAALGERILIFGDQAHPEVRGLYSYAGPGTVIFKTLPELEGYDLSGGEKYCLAAQTTQDRQAFNQIVAYLKEQVGPAGLTVLDTICATTRVRQEEVRAMAEQVEAMVVVGGRNSGNTKRLVIIAREKGLPCFHVETELELPLDELKQYERLGLSAGASTPRQIIDRVEQALLRL